MRESIKTTLFESEDLAGTRQFRCGEGWETAKNQDHRSSCPECFANDVTEIGWTA